MSFHPYLDLAKDEVSGNHVFRAVSDKAARHPHLGNADGMKHEAEEDVYTLAYIYAQSLVLATCRTML